MRSVPTALQSPFAVAVLLIAGAAAAQTSRDITIIPGGKDMTRSSIWYRFAIAPVSALRALRGTVATFRVDRPGHESRESGAPTGRSSKIGMSPFLVRRLVCWHVSLASVLGFLVREAAAQPTPMYTVKNLGTLSPGSVTVALAINNSGQVVGGSGGHAFLYSGGGLVDLGVPSGWDTSSAFGINSAGQITITATHGVSPGGFVYSNGGFTNIGNLGGDVLASGINDSGEVVGYAATPTGNHVVVYSAGTLQDLGNLGASAGAIAYGINNAGQITGFLNRGSGASSQFQAYLYSNGTAKNLGTLGGTSSIGYAINNLGQVAGGASLPPLSLGSPEPGHAFLDTNGIMKDLDPGGGATGSVGLGINDLGDVVGYKYFGGNQSATLWRGGQIINLNSVVQGTSDLTLDAAYGINDSGWIVGSGSTASGDQHAFLAIPTPEPSAAALLLLWTALLLRRRRAGRW